ncbi:MAG: type II toxin-antitoxin system MqsA family antitoxin [Salinibacter sp.]
METTDDTSDTPSPSMEDAPCPLCPTGSLRKGTTTLTLERDGATIVFKGVPAEVCNACGEAYLDEDVSEEVYKQAEAAIEAGAEVGVRHYSTTREPKAS